MPPIGYVTSDVDFRNLSWNLRPAVQAQNGAPAQSAINLNYGAFINNVITFLIVAWAVFLLVKAVNLAETRLRLGEQPPADVPPPPENTLLLREIRDSLKKT
jgi:large conductance mechanosensitive channel